MQIGDLARMAGTTARAVRHYHRAGVLPEPARRANGYRDYDISDLVRVMRIRWLLTAGLTLREVAAMLQNDRSADVDLDGQLLAALGRVEVERARLDTQERVLRELLRRVQSGQALSAVDDDLRGAMDAVAKVAAPASHSLMRTERAAVDLMVHSGLAHAKAQESLAAVYRRVAEDPGLAVALVEVTERLEALTGADPQFAVEEIDATAAQLESVLVDVDIDGFIGSLEAAEGSAGTGEDGLWLATLLPDPAHRAVMHRVLSRRSL
ncbi:MerR family transcriptional regulator [Georgenia sp. M64]|uniref:helix-turn-helix domain-containing protein n=1 Tax=Georgenia sp. M64 TaxID=3120520 RepID=UPI0030DDFB6A